MKSIANRISFTLLVLVLLFFYAIPLPSSSAARAEFLTAGGIAADPGVAVRLKSDFNGDGYSDLAVGVPDEDIDTIHDAGVVHVICGSSHALITTGSQLWSQNSYGIEGAAEDGDLFGEALAVGDFDHDGLADLAIGAPGEDIDGKADVGVVHVLYGAAGGLTYTGCQLWHQDSPGISDQAEAEDRFGSSLATGDFNGDGFEDLAVGVPEEDVSGTTDAGAVHLLYGAPGGLSSKNNRLVTQADSGIAGEPGYQDFFGSALASGNFNRDEFYDLAIGVPSDTVNSVDLAGAVNVLYGSRNGLTPAGSVYLNQSVLLGTLERMDEFGSALATADFNSDGADDLAVGAPGEALDSSTDAGSVNIIYGSAPNGLTDRGNQWWNRDMIEGFHVADDYFGTALAAGDLNRDGCADLAINGSYTISGKWHTGAVTVLYGSAKGLSTLHYQLWHQDQPDIQGTCDFYDRFGHALTMGDFNLDGFGDLAIGVPGDSGTGVSGAGAVNVLYGTNGGLSSNINGLWTQNNPGIDDQAETSDGFGNAVAAR